MVGLNRKCESKCRFRQHAGSIVLAGQSLIASRDRLVLRLKRYLWRVKDSVGETTSGACSGVLCRACRYPGRSLIG